MLNILKNKKIVLILIGILSIPFVIPIVEILVNSLFYVGRYVGTFVRGLMEVRMC